MEERSLEKYYLAIDIGASGGRHILAYLQEDKIVTDEIYRFPNGMVEKDGRVCWDIKSLYKEILTGMKICKELGKIPSCLGIDTWAVDFVLLDSANCILGDVIAYRDDRTKGMDKKVAKIISPEDLYSRTGIQKQIFNTIYQLMAVKEKYPEQMQRADCMLMIPDYLNFLLTDQKTIEYTNATTTQLVRPDTKDWDYELIDKLEYPRKLFTKITRPGTIIGSLNEKVEEEVGFNCDVILPATHDTGSAVLAIPTNDDNALYISSGTWSLMGVGLKEANCSIESMKKNFTNEGGYDYRFRYLKNIMGLWMIQSIRHEYKDAYTFEELCTLADESNEFSSLVDVNHESFLAPKSMIQAIKTYCESTNQPIPERVGEVAAVIYNSLAKSYKEVAEELEEITGRSYPAIYIAGGGSKAEYLNEITAKVTGKTVYAGPAEATSIGNIIAQMLAVNEFTSLAEAKRAIINSFHIKKYEPTK